MSFATTTWPDNGGYHTERKYCLYHMRRSCFAPSLSAARQAGSVRLSISGSPTAKMVEAPGTAPGSALLISQHVYRHSWNSSNANIGVLGLVSKNSFDFDVVSVSSSVEKGTLFLFW